MRNPWLRINIGYVVAGHGVVERHRAATLKIAKGDTAGRAEADLMVREKVEAGMALGQMVMLGGLGITPHGAARRTVAHYRRKVRANARRLSKL